MVQPFQKALQQAVFLFHDTLPLRKVMLPKPWYVLKFSAIPEVISWSDGAKRNDHPLVIAMPEIMFPTFLTSAKTKTFDFFDKYGRVLVVCSNPKKFLSEVPDDASFCEIISEVDFAKTIEYRCVSLVKQIWHRSRAISPKATQKTLEQLNEAFIDLASERNPEKLLTSIVSKAMKLTGATGGLLYMLEEKEGELYFQTRIFSDKPSSVSIQNTPTKVTENTYCGYVALTGKLVNVADLAAVRSIAVPQYHKMLDYFSGETPHHLLTLPLKSSRNEIVAVLQLADKTETSQSHTNPFDSDDESLMNSYSTQAAICLQNVDLYADVQRLFDGFVKASVAAIESRDPSTAGHSERVAKMTVALARATTECEVGIYRSVRFRDDEIRELEYAALLHDFGKIGVREEVLVKAKKLYAFQLEAIRDRMKICQAAAKIAYLEKAIDVNGNRALLENEFEHRLKELEQYWELIVTANEPSVVRTVKQETFDRIRNEQLLLPDGSFISLLTTDEYDALSITRGSLTGSERIEIMSHVRHTHQFLKMIPWTKDFKHLTEIAYCHHEKLDGSGYPRGLISHEIPLQSKIMTIADIFDALTASDRWYKEAVPTAKALDILHDEVNQGRLDPVLFDLFVERKVYEICHPKELSHKVA